MVCRVIFNKKGGVGKTTITCNLAAISASSGQKTIVVDLDPQANASQYLLRDRYNEIKEQGRTIFDFFKASLDGGSIFEFNPFFSHLSSPRPEPESFIHQTRFDNLYVIPSHSGLADLEAQLVSKHKIYKLKEMLEKISGFEAVFIDTPPAMNFFSQSALIAASRCLIPFDCDAFSKDAIFDVGKHIGDIQRDHNNALIVEGIIVNQFMARAAYPKKIVDELKADGLPILATKISSSVKIRESHHESTPMIFLSPGHKLTQEYQALYDEISRKGQF
ncbi:ParA family protein [Desulfopila sp. IMCC35006]|uniref:ParA family protein n=1 Tax=Desulfopila sp. IMCC35006 TaxID=2569542 RepID=UPI0010AC79E5|nr:ParA family protein [Desulfopila sp. IMCC35006]